MRTPKASTVADSATALCDAHRIQSKDDLVGAIGAVADGNKAAFAFLYAATAAKLFGIIVRIVRRRDVAEDVLQEVYLRVWQHANSFDAHTGSPITWMATIARRRALDEVRRKDATLPIDECPEVLHLLCSDHALANDKDRPTGELTAALQRLSRDKRAILVQAYCYGFTREEIARQVGCPVPTVKTWLRRALAELRGHLR